MDNHASEFIVTRAVREAVPALIGLWGPSGSGKTYTALLLARGLVGPKGKIILIDTENRRAKFHSDIAGGWEHIDFQPPFTAQRYTAAMQKAEKDGANVIIIDSTSHVWEGEGGTLDQADSVEIEGLGKWKGPKTAYKRMMNHLLRSPVHVIFCLRAKDKNVQVGRGKGAKIEYLGLVPIMEKNFIYEMTLSAQLDPETHAVTGIPKVPGPLVEVVKTGLVLDEASGQRIAQWLAGGATLDTALEALKREARNRAMLGTTKLRDFWMTELTKPQRHSLASILEELKMSATQADDEAARAMRGDDQQTDPLDDPFTTKTDAPAGANGAETKTAA